MMEWRGTSVRTRRRFHPFQPFSRPKEEADEAVRGEALALGVPGIFSVFPELSSILALAGINPRSPGLSDLHLKPYSPCSASTSEKLLSPTPIRPAPLPELSFVVSVRGGRGWRLVVRLLLEVINQNFGRASNWFR